MAKSYEIDLQLEWFCSGDLVFTHDDFWKSEISLHVVKTKDETRSLSPFLILRRGHDYRIGQLYDFTHDSTDNNYSCDAMRHPALIRQDYKLPDNIPFHDSFFGPMSAINMMRIIRVVQAGLFKDAEVRDDAYTNLKEYYDERLPRYQSVQNILAFRRA